MKSLLFFLICLGAFIYSFSASPSLTEPDPTQLIGEWKLDMSPENRSDTNFALMRITHIEGNSFSGTFYREGVKIQEGRINTQRGIIYGALLSADGSGDYYTAFYYEEGILYGSTHALQRKFLSVWTATKTQ